MVPGSFLNQYQQTKSTIPAKQYAPPLKYRIYVPWLNAKLVSDQQYILPDSGCGHGTNAESCLSELCAWAAANPEAQVALVYDSRTTTPKAVENTRIKLSNLLLGAMPVPKSTAERGVLLQDIREITIVRDNPDSFSGYLPIYFKVDLIKFILCLHSLENQGDDCVIVSDFLVGNSPTKKGEKMTKNELFSPEILLDLQQYGIKLGNDAGKNVENQFFQVMSSPKILNVLKLVINICLNYAVTSLNIAQTKQEALNYKMRLISLSDFVYEPVFKPCFLFCCFQGMELVIEKEKLNVNFDYYNKLGNTIYGSHTATAVFENQTIKLTVPKITLTNFRLRDVDQWEEWQTLLSRNVCAQKIGNLHSCHYEDLEECPPENGDQYKCTFIPIYPIPSKEAQAIIDKIGDLELAICKQDKKAAEEIEISLNKAATGVQFTSSHDLSNIKNALDALEKKHQTEKDPFENEIAQYVTRCKVAFNICPPSSDGNDFKKVTAGS